ncbi:damage-binding protein 1 [Seminavis robusta]|uniref:Damage-binding protein 1 n=1 Tax=Seminavis robusta TaxID=568900 RepID=A0A9N8DK79_9STRA|nr:damage-binding protein 1 [Seminavis robusta]|eukprot:Sro204_g085810.1 damage-binding protein 1 (583) ;mRNA; r:20750-22584
MSSGNTANTATGTSSASGTPKSNTNSSSATTSGKSTIAKEVSHYVVTAHPPGGVLFTCKGHFVASHDAASTQDVIVAKSRRLELRTWQSSSNNSTTNANSTTTSNNDGGGGDHNKTSLFPVLATTPIHGRLTCLQTLKLKKSSVDMIFVTTDRHQYAVLSYEPTMRPYPFRTHASGRLPSGEDPSLLGRRSESGPLVAMDPQHRCIALHWLDGLVTIIPIDQNYNPPLETTAAATDNMPAYWPKAASSQSNSNNNKSCLKEPFHVRMEERTLLNMVFLQANNSSANSASSGNLKTDEGTAADVQIPPQLTLLHQDSRGTQHVYTHSVDLRKHSFSAGNLKRSRVDGGSSWMIPVPASRPILQPPQGDAAATTSNNNTTTTTKPNGTITLGGVIVLGQRQITYANPTTTKVTPVPPCLFLSWDALPDDPKGMPRYLLADEFGNLHLLSFLTYHARIYTRGQSVGTDSRRTHSQWTEGHPAATTNNNNNAMEDDHSVDDATTTAAGNTSNNNNSSSGDMDWMVDSTYLTVVEEYTHLGPIVDFDLVPTAPGLANNTNTNQPSQVVTASGTSRADLFDSFAMVLA